MSTEPKKEHHALHTIYTAPDLLIRNSVIEQPLCTDKKNSIRKVQKTNIYLPQTSWLVRSTPDRVVRVRGLAGDIALCTWARHFTLTVPLSTQVYNWVPA